MFQLRHPKAPPVMAMLRKIIFALLTAALLTPGCIEMETSGLESEGEEKPLPFELTFESKTLDRSEDEGSVFSLEEELENAIKKIRNNTSSGGLGINLIVNKSNIKLNKQLEICLKLGVDFIITSLGNPKEVIQQCKPKGIKVFCDVIEEKYAKKVEEIGSANLFIVSKGTLKTPKLNGSILDGVTRDSVCKIGSDLLGLKVEETDIFLEDLFQLLKFLKF